MRALVVGMGMVLLFATGSAGQSPVPLFEARGFASFGYSFNVGRPETKQNHLRVFDFDDQRFKIDVAELVLQRPAATAGAFGFRADLVAGGSIPRISAASGLFRDPATGLADPGTIDLQQAYLSYLAAVGSGLRIEAGKFTTHIGAEVIEGYDGYGDNYSRGYLFGYGEPATHTGVRVGYTFTPKVSALLLVVNGWDNVKDNNRAKSFGAQVAFMPADAVTLYANYLGGAERADSGDLRHLLDIVAVTRPSATTTITVSYDRGFEANAAGPGADGTWQGLSVSGKVDLSARYHLAVRAEAFADRDGVRTGTPQTVTAVTVTPGIKLTSRLSVRGEARWDRSTQPVFVSRHTSTRHQGTIAANAIVVF